MNTIIGVDPSSSKCVAVVLREDGYEIHVLWIRTKDFAERSLLIFRWMRRIVVGEDAPVTMYLERPVYAPKRGGLKALLPLGEVQGSIAAGALSGGARVVRVSPSEWKMSVLGKGNGAASKLKIKMYLKKHWQSFYLESDGDIDICDAGAIALHGRKCARIIQGVKSVARSRGGVRSRPPGSRSVARAPRTGVPALVKNSKSK